MPSMEVLHASSAHKTWHLRFTDHKGYRRRLSTYSRDRTVALGISRKVEMLVATRIKGDALEPDLSQWLAEACHKDLRERLMAWGIVEGGAATAGLHVSKHLAAWEDALLDEERSEPYAHACKTQVSHVLNLATPPIAYAGAITAVSVDAALKFLRRTGPPVDPKLKRRRKGWSPQTCNDALVRIQQFCGWLRGKGVLRSEPLAGMKGYSPEVVRQNRKRKRRSLSIEEVVGLLTTTEGQPARWRMTGQQRANLYRLVLNTGLRAYECSQMAVHWFDLKALTLTIPANVCKASRDDVLPIRADLAPMLTEQFMGKLPGAAAWPSINEGNYSKMIYEDLAAAKIAKKDLSDNWVDFHALRHTYGTMLAVAGVPVAAHMELMRHKDLKTTLKYYVHLKLADRAAGVEKLPGMAPVVKKTKTA